MRISAHRLEEIGALATLVDENRFSYRLDDLCKWRGLPGKDTALLEEACRAAGFKINKTHRLQSYIWQLPAHLAGPYAEADARDAYRLDCDLLPMVDAMRRRGIRIDQSAAEQGRDYCLQKRDAALTALSEQLGNHVSMSEIASRKWLERTFDAHAIGYPRTAKGNPSFQAGKRGWMVPHPHWLPQLIATANKYHDAGSKFLEGHILAHLIRGRVYAEINPHRSEEGGTKSSRFSYAHPPLQQMPSHDPELGPLIRRVFLPEEGATWCTVDCSQQEFRFVVHHAFIRNLAGAAQAVERYRIDPDTDFHALAGEITSMLRKDAKAVNFARIYGAGIKKFAEMIGKPLAEARVISAKYDRALPFLSRLAVAAQNEAKQHGYTPLYDGARRHWDLWATRNYVKGIEPCALEEAKQRVRDPNHPWFRHGLQRVGIHTALNAQIQGDAARHTKLWMRACSREGVMPLLQMHDGLELSVTTREQGELVARLACEAVQLEMPMRADVKYGRTWGDATHTWEARNDAAPTPPIIETVPIAAEDEPEDDSVAVASIPFMITQAKKAQLRAQGCAEQEIIEMTPAQAHDRLGLVEAAPRENPMPTQPEPAPLAADTDVPRPRTNGHAGANGSLPDHGLSAGNRVKHDSDGKVHGEDGPKRGRCTAQWYYPHLDGSHYLRVDRHDLPNGDRKFYQHHWNGSGWVYGVKDTYAERKIPYRLPELKAALQANPDVQVQICEGESDADAMARLGFVATTNPGGALSWTPELTAWLRALGVRHAAIQEDNDGVAQKFKGQKRTARLIKELSDFIKLKVVRYPDVPEGQDVRWWLEHGHTKTELEARIAAAESADSVITAAPYQFCAEADIPAWQWLYGWHLLRAEVAGTAAMGGTGKSTLSIVEALMMASGRALLGVAVPGPLRVVLINLEDTRNTMDKRIAAVMRFYGLTPADIGDRLIVIAKGEVKLKVARQLRSGDVERNKPIIASLIGLMRKHQADVLSIDSFIRTHRVNENDNSAVQEVVECFEDIATETQCAVHLWHHTRKGGGERATIESARGAIAFVDACRSARVLETMSAKEHQQLVDINPDMLPAGFYFRAFNGKRNFAPPAEASDWFKLENLLLANGDNVGVVVTWAYPETTEDITPEMVDRIVAEIDRGMPNGRRYSNHNSATTRPAWPIVQKYCSMKTENQCRQIVVGWIKRGLLYEDTYQDPKQRKPLNGLFARKPVTETPQPEETEDEE